MYPGKLRQKCGPDDFFTIITIFTDQTCLLLSCFQDLYTTPYVLIIHRTGIHKLSVLQQTAKQHAHTTVTVGVAARSGRGKRVPVQYHQIYNLTYTNTPTHNFDSIPVD